MRCPVRPVAVGAVLRRRGLSIAEYVENCVVSSAAGGQPFGIPRLDDRHALSEKFVRRLIARFPIELGTDAEAVIEEMCEEQMQRLSTPPVVAAALAMNRNDEN